MEVVRAAPFFFSAISVAPTAAGGVEEVIQKRNWTAGANLVQLLLLLLLSVFLFSLIILLFYFLFPELKDLFFFVVKGVVRI